MKTREGTNLSAPGAQIYTYIKDGGKSIGAKPLNSNDVNTLSRGLSFSKKWGTFRTIRGAMRLRTGALVRQERLGQISRYHCLRVIMADTQMFFYEKSGIVHRAPARLDP
jgi:hypothetical protein